MSNPALDNARRSAPAWLPIARRVIRWMPVGRYRAVHWLDRRPVAPFWTRLPLDLGGLEYRCSLSDALMREACLTGRYEPQETALLQHFVRPGMTVVDVGANRGYFTLMAGHLVGAGGRVLAVEADPRACRLIRANLERNGLTHVVLVEGAVAEGDAVLVFGDYDPGVNDGGNCGLAPSTTIAAAGPRREIRARALYDVLDEAGLERVDLVKMDIEGGEARALRGLGRRLARGAVDRILLELHPNHLRALGATAERVVGDLVAYGWSASTIDHSPAAHRRAAAGPVDARRLLTLFDRSAALGDWPHVLFSRLGPAA